MNKLIIIGMLSVAFLLLSGCVTTQLPTYPTGPATQVTLPQAGPGQDLMPMMASMATNVQQVDVVRMSYKLTLGYSGGSNGRPRLPVRDDCRITVFKAGSANGLPAERCRFPEQTRYLENLLFTFEFKGHPLEFEMASYPFQFVEGAYYEEGMRIGPLVAMPGSRQRQKKQMVVKIYLPAGSIP